MAHSYISYNKREFYASDGLIDLAQKYLLKLLEKADKPDWILEFIEDIELDTEMDTFRSFYLEDDFDTEEKRAWFINFIQENLINFDKITNEKFGIIIQQKINDAVDLKKVKTILDNLRLLLLEQEPQHTC